MSDAVRGSQATAATNTGNTQSRVRAVLKEPTRVEPLNTSLLRLTNALQGKAKLPFTAKGYKPEWQAQMRFLRYVTVSSTAPTTGNTIIFDDVSYIQVDQVVRYKREIIHLTAVDTSTGSCTARRDLGSTGINSIPAGAKLAVLAPAFGEGTAKSVSFGKNPKFAYNLSQITKRAVGITRTQAQTTQYHTADEFEYQLRLNRDEAEEEIERTWLTQDCAPIELATNVTGNSGSFPKRFAAGIPYFLRTNRVNFNGRPSWHDLDLMFQRAVRNGDGAEFMCFCPEKVLAIFSTYGAEAVRTTQEMKTLQREITILSGSGWRAHLVPAYQLEGDFYSSAFFALNMNYIFPYWLQGWMTDEDIQTPGDDLSQDQILCEGCPIVMNESSHIFAYGLN